jgi:hypothetical protein
VVPLRRSRRVVEHVASRIYHTLSQAEDEVDKGVYFVVYICMVLHQLTHKCLSEGSNNLLQCFIPNV